MALPHGKRIWAGMSLLLVVVGLVVVLGVIRQRQSLSSQAKYTELGITITNLTNNAFSVWWKAPDRQTGCVMINAQVPVCDDRKAFTHLISINNLTSGQTYQILIKHGQRTMLLSPFWGQGISLPSPPKYDSPTQPLSGRVVTADGRPLDQATVFIAPDLTDRMYLPLAALTNDEGEFSFADLADLKFQGVFNPDAYFIEVTDKNGNKLLEATFPEDRVKSVFTLTIPK